MKSTHRIFAILLLPFLLLFAVGVARADKNHVVQPGDTLFTIAMQYGVTMDAIIEANNIINPRVIVLGSTLIIPGIEDPTPIPPTRAATPTPAATAAATTSPTPTTNPTPPPDSRQVEGGVIHIIKPRESLSRISLIYNVSIANIMEANELTNSRLIVAGRELFIPGARLGGTTANGTPATPAATTPAGTTATTGANLFKNGSFEGDWYYHIYNELQIPVGWQVAIDEGPNTLQPGDGGNFARPEIRVVSRAALAEDEGDQFIFDGFKTLKAFKGYAPTIFHYFQDVYLQPGRYRMTLNFFPDIVSQYYPGGRRDFHTDPLAAEMKVIHNTAATDWTTVTIGQRNSRVYEFTVSQPGTARLGASFRNRYAAANNGWFLDDWKLERIGR